LDLNPICKRFETNLKSENRKGEKKIENSKEARGAISAQL
jgi:hypothetical protein